MMAQKKRKTRVTKKDIIKIREERKVTSYQAKKRIVPGPWTNKKTKIKVNVSIKYNDTGIMAEILGPAYGTYKETVLGEKGWYKLIFNLVADNMKEIITKHGMDEFLTACEKSLNEQKDEQGKPKYGTIIITEMSVDGSQRDDINRRFISCHGKTNKKSIKGFRATRKGEMIVI